MDDEVAIRLRLLDQQRTSSGIRDTTEDVDHLGRALDHAGDQASQSARQTDKATRSYASLRAGTKGVSGGIGIVTRGLGRAAAAAGGLYVLGSGFKFAFGEATEAAKVGAQTNAVLKSTGAVAGVTSKHVGDLAGQISSYAGIDDEAVQQGENLLLTFTNIRNGVGKGNKVFDQATVAATNMGVALGTDTASAAMMLGKALNDPAKGYSRLQRSGVSFTAGQIKQIKTLSKNGKQLEAQKIILREVRKEFGGSAAAQAQPMEKLRVTIGNLAETVGTVLLPYVNKAASGLNTFVKQMQNGQGAGGKFLGIVKAVGSTIIDIYTGLKTGLSGGQFWEDQSPLLIKVGMAARTVRAGFIAVIGAVRSAIPPVTAFAQKLVGAFTSAVGPIRPVLTALRLVGTRVVQIAQFIGGILKPAVNALGQIFTGVFQVIGGAIRTVSALIHGDFGGALEGIKSIVTGVKNTVVGAFRGILGVGKNIFGALGRAIGGAIKAPINAVIGAWNGLNFHIGIPKKVFGVSIPGGGSGIDINTPDIPQLARGTRNFFGGTALVGERGPELVSIPGGSAVLNASRTSAALAGARMPAPVLGGGYGLAGGGSAHIVVQSILDGELVAVNTARHDLDWDERG